MHLPTYLDATGNVGPASGGTLRAVSLAAGSAAATATIRQGGSGGSIILTIKAAANESHSTARLDAVYAGQLHVTLAGTGAVVTVVV
jgi:hypothetical protein